MVDVSLHQAMLGQVFWSYVRFVANELEEISLGFSLL